jgi:hypothetical protein
MSSKLEISISLVIQGVIKVKFRRGSTKQFVGDLDKIFIENGTEVKAYLDSTLVE